MSETTTVASFNQYGKAFQEKAFQAMMTDTAFADQMLEVFDSSYFDLKYLNLLSSRYFDYAKRYKTFPSLQILVTIIRDELKVGNDIVLRDQIVEYLTRMRSNPDPGDLAYVKEKSLDFCRKQALKAALEHAVDQMQANKYESIVDDIKRAVCVGTTPSLGHDFFEDTESRFTLLSRNCVATGLPELDKKDIFNGGLGAGEIGIVVAAPGVGKSHFLTFVGANALRAKKNVVHYTFELSEEQIGRRYDSNFCRMNSNEVIENKDKVLNMYKDMDLGRLRIKYFPTGTASIFSLRSHIERLELKGFRPDMIVIDYADIMRSSRQYEAQRFELKLIYEELRGFAGEKKIPVWTASQSNKEGSTAEVVDLNNMSEAYGKAMVADVVVSLSRRAHEKAAGVGRLYVAKNRAGRDGVVFPIKIDTGMSDFEITGGEGDLQEIKQQDESDFKRTIRNKWSEMKAEKLVKDEAQ